MNTSNDKILKNKSSKSSPIQTKKRMKAPKPLLHYHHDGYNYKIIKRSGMVGLFQQQNPGGIAVAYELIIIQTNKRKEYPPASEDWGILGWSYKIYDNSVKAFNQAIKYQSKKFSVVTFASNQSNPGNGFSKPSYDLHIEL